MKRAQVWRWGGVIAALLISTSLAILFGVRWQTVRDDFDQEATQHAISQATSTFRIDQTQSLALAAQAEALLKAGNTTLALALALEAVKGNAPPLQAQSALAAAAYEPGIRQVIELRDMFLSDGLAVTPDGQTLIYGGRSQIIFADVSTGQELKRLDDAGEGVICLAVSPDGRWLLSIAKEAIKVWDLASGEVIAVLEDPVIQAWIEGVIHEGNGVFLPDGRLLLWVRHEAPMVWDVEANRVLRRLDMLPDDPRSMALRPDGKAVLFGFWEDDPLLVDIESGAILKQYEGDGTGVESVVFDTYGSVFFTGSDHVDSPVLMRDAETGEILRRFGGAWGVVNRLAISSDGRFLLGNIGQSQGVVLWKVNTGQVIHIYRNVPGDTAISIMPDGQRAVVGTDSGEKAYMLDLTSGAEHHQFPGQPAPVQGLVFSPDGTQTLMIDRGEGLLLWDTKTGQRLRHFVHEGADIDAAVFAPDGQTVYAVDRDCLLIRWDVASGEVLEKWPTQRDSFCDTLAISPDGERIAVNDWLDQLTIWEASTGTLILQKDGYDLSHIEFSPDGHTLLMLGGSSSDARVMLTAADTGEVQWVIGDEEVYPPNISHVRFSPDGQQFLAVYGFSDQVLMVHDIATRNVLFQKEGVQVADFAPDGSMLGLGMADGTLALWDISTQRELRRWRAATRSEYNNGPFFNLWFSPDGRWLATLTAGSEATLWRIDSLEELKTWAVHNRYMPEPACEQDVRYRLEATCDASNQVATYTPVPTLTATPTPNLTQTTVTATLAVSPTSNIPALPPTVTASSTASPPPPTLPPPAPLPTLPAITFLPSPTMWVFGTVATRPTGTPSTVSVPTGTLPTSSVPTSTASPAPTLRPSPTSRPPVVVTVAAGDSAGLATALAMSGPTVIELGEGTYDLGEAAIIDEDTTLNGASEQVIPAGDIPSLIAALVAANENPEMDIIRLEAGVYVFSQAYVSDTALPVITAAITLEGQGAVFERTEDSSAFRFFLVSESGHLVLRDLTLKNGGGEALNGGGILNQGVLDLNNVTVRHSRARKGGALSNEGGQVSAQDCVFADNTAVEIGGAIENDAGELVIIRSSFTNNNAQGAGGIHNTGSMNIQDCDLSGIRFEN